MTEFIEIEVGRELRAKVDTDMYWLVRLFEWRTHKMKTARWYARTYINGGHIYMHRLVMAARTGDQIDHKNHDGLDNRRVNLRFCTQSQNQQNRKKITSSSKRKGVTFHRQSEKWQAQIGFERHNFYLGLFATKDEASIAYAAAATVLFGEFRWKEEPP